jgi:virginiamycin B lyase
MRMISVVRWMVALSTLAATTADAQGPSASVEMQEWTVPWARSRPRDPAVDPHGLIWFVGQEGNYVARLDPATGEFKRFEIDPGTFPHTVTIDRAGNAWYAGNRNGMIGRIDPASGRITRYPMPDPAAKDPHTMVFDKAGDLWFTMQQSNFIGKLTTKTGHIALLKVPTPNARPYGIVLDAGGRPWFCLFGTNKLGTVDPATMALKEFALPEADARPRRIAMTSDGRVWYVDYMRGELGVLDPNSGRVQAWPTPAGKASLPYALTVDDKDRLWFVETGRQPNRMIGFDPKPASFFGITEIKSGGGTVRHMVFDRATGLIWFGTDNNTIGRAVVSPKPVM